MKEAKTNLAVSNDKKLHRVRIGATISVAISLVLLIVLVSFQIYWNVFRFRFVKDGCAVVVDNQLAVGVEKIIRGEEANRIFREKNADYRDIEEGNEVVLVKIKVKNMTPWNAARRYMEFELYTKEPGNDYDRASDLLYGVVKSPDGEYKILDTSKVFRPGETRDGVFYFEVEKDKPLLRVDVHSNYYKWFSHKSIALSKFFLDKTGIFIFLIAFIFLLYWLIFYFLLKQRQRKRVNPLNGVFYYYLNLWPLFMQISYLALQIKPTWLIWIFILSISLIILILIYLYLGFKRYTFLFYWLKKDDLTLIISGFKKRIGWDASEMKETIASKIIFHAFLDSRYYDAIEIFNEKTKEIFTFTTRGVKVKNSVSDTKSIKVLIRELYNETELDWLGYYSDIFYTSILFSMLFILYYFFISIIS